VTRNALWCASQHAYRAITPGREEELTIWTGQKDTFSKRVRLAFCDTLAGCSPINVPLMADDLGFLSAKICNHLREHLRTPFIVSQADIKDAMKMLESRDGHSFGHSEPETASNDESQSAN
jgi:hypothetical protein